MTIITAIADPENKTVWLGSNGRATIGSFVSPSRDRKWVSFGSWAIGITGSGPKLEALDAMAGDFPKNADQPFEVVKFLREAYAAFDIGETEEGLKRYAGGGLIAHKSGRIWDHDNSFCLTAVDAGVFWARGSGMDIALGASLALCEFIPSPLKRTRRVLEIVTANDVDSPGEILVQSFDEKANLSDPLEV